MIQIFCRAHHDAADAPCEECLALLDYALQRLERCPFGADKPTCAKCPIHCYRPAMRERIRTVMRYAGPRMLPRHPILALRHCLDAAKRVPKR
ncbi:MAG TPA: nitrous oxide-stimulated promoter family protein [Planctomycetaceae bacterium]|nr:nitrous oxide-stimulated promoter family protein [Planctomycetaceae bacterium]